MDNENTYRYGAGSYQEQDLEIQRAQERQARQQEEDARRVHDEQMAAIERQRAQQHQQSRNRSQKQTKPKGNTRTQSAPAAATDPNEALDAIIAAAGIIIGIYITNAYVTPKEDWHIWIGIIAGGGLAYTLREPIKWLLKMGIIFGLIYVGIVYLLPALST